MALLATKFWLLLWQWQKTTLLTTRKFNLDTLHWKSSQAKHYFLDSFLFFVCLNHDQLRRDIFFMVESSWLTLKRLNQDNKVGVDGAILTGHDAIIVSVIWRLCKNGQGLTWGHSVNTDVWACMSDRWVIFEVCFGSKSVTGVLGSSAPTKTCVCMCDCDEVRRPVLLQGPVTQGFHQSLAPLLPSAVLSLL